MRDLLKYWYPVMLDICGNSYLGQRNASLHVARDIHPKRNLANLFT